MCGYEGCLYEETLRVREWRRLLELAQEHDIERGGHYAARMDAIGFWASPEDRPADPEWTRVEIRKAGLSYARAYVGVVHGTPLEAEGELNLDERVSRSIASAGGVQTPSAIGSSRFGDRIRLHWVISPFEKAEAIVGPTFLDAASYEDEEAAAKDFASQADLEWCRAKFRELLALIDSETEPP